jgi:hypothetical protein
VEKDFLRKKIIVFLARLDRLVNLKMQVLVDFAQPVLFPLLKL